MNPILRANSMNTSNMANASNDAFWSWVESKNNPQDKYTKACKEINKQHFDEMLEWNIQTTMYHLLVDIVSTIDLKYLSTIAELYKADNINNISAQLEDAILDVLIQKRLIKNKKPKDKLII